MQPTTALALKAVAQSIRTGAIPNPCPVIVQRAIAVFKILDDGQWHTATQIAAATGIGAKYARDICRACASEWGLYSHRSKGWWMPDDADGDCRLCGGTGYDVQSGDPESLCPSCDGQGDHQNCSTG